VTKAQFSKVVVSIISISFQAFSTTALKPTSLFAKDFLNGNHKQADDNANFFEKEKHPGTSFGVLLI
jgi:hypothetical protein